MPIFNFKCGKCGKVFETLLKNRSESAVCPECGSEELTAMPNRISVGSNVKSGACSMADSCPSAGGGCCGGGCCGHRH